MSYCTLDDIQNIFPRYTFDATSKPSSTQIEELIIAVSDGIMDSRLRTVAALPLGEEKALAYLKQLCIWNVAAQVLRMMNVDPELSGSYQKLFDDGFKGLLESPELLNPVSQSIPGPTSHPSSSTQFKRGESQW